MNLAQTSRWRGTISCGLALGAIGTLMPCAAQADTTARAASLADAALITHWSLPATDITPGALPEPVFGREPAAPAPAAPLIEPTKPAELGAMSNEAASIAPSAPAAPTPAGPQAAHAAAIGEQGSSPTASRQRGYISYGEPRWRMPRDIVQLEIAYQVLNVADGALTIACLKRDDCQEDNPIYGKHPKVGVVIGAKVLSGAIHYWVTRSLAEEHPGFTRVWGWFSMTVQGGVVGLNMSQLF